MRHSREKQKLALNEARTVVKKIETELKENGVRGVQSYEVDSITSPPLRLSHERLPVPGRTINLNWELNLNVPSLARRDGWESKKVEIGVLQDGDTIVGYSQAGEQGFGRINWLDESSEYLILEKTRAGAGREMPTLEEKIKFAMEKAVPTPDYRHTKG